MIRRRILAAVVIAAATMPAHARGWADLWFREDQQTIAQRQQAYAEIEGQRYAEAVRHLEPFRDPVSQYNRGNALARAHDLQGALGAYDAVLKDTGASSDLHRDAQHNRDLVAKQLESQQQDSKDSKQNSDHAQKKEDGKPGDSGKQGGSGQQSNAGEQGSDVQQSEQSKPDNKGKSGEQGQSAEQDSQNHTDANKAEAQQARIQGKDKDRGAPQPQSTGAQDGARAQQRGGDASQDPQSPQAQSLDRWLRWIPDDPAGLLRRKFMVEHMRQQERGE